MTTRTSRRVCECETVTCPWPSDTDRFQQAERRMPNPVCPVHAATDDLEPSDFDADDTLETFGVAYSLNRGEWVEADGWDEETGEPYTEDGAE